MKTEELFGKKRERKWIKRSESRGGNRSRDRGSTRGGGETGREMGSRQGLEHGTPLRERSRLVTLVQARRLKCQADCASTVGFPYISYLTFALSPYSCGSDTINKSANVGYCYLIHFHPRALHNIVSLMASTHPLSERSNLLARQTILRVVESSIPRFISYSPSHSLIH